MAHKAIWEDFEYRSNVRNDTLEQKQRNILIIFEDDVFPRIKDHIEVTLKDLLLMKEDIRFLGGCMSNPNQHEVPPFCTHAYAVSGTGAKSKHLVFPAFTKL